MISLNAKYFMNGLYGKFGKDNMISLNAIIPREGLEHEWTTCGACQRVLTEAEGTRVLIGQVLIDILCNACTKVIRSRVFNTVKRTV